MTDLEAWEYLKENNRVIVNHMLSVVRDVQSAEELATRVIVKHDTEDIRELIKAAARHMMGLEVERRR